DQVVAVGAEADVAEHLATVRDRRLAHQAHLAGGRLLEAEQQVDQRGLPAAVRPDNAPDHPGFGGEVDRAERELWVGEGDPARPKQVTGVHAVLAGRRYGYAVLVGRR